MVSYVWIDLVLTGSQMDLLIPLLIFLGISRSFHHALGLQKNNRKNWNQDGQTFPSKQGFELAWEPKGL